MEIDPVGDSIALLSRYNPAEPFTHELGRAAEKVAKFLYDQGITPKNPLPIDTLCIARLTPLLETIVRTGLKQNRDSATIEVFDNLLTIAHVAYATSTIFHQKTDTQLLTEAVDLLEKHILNPDFIEESRTSNTKRKLLCSLQQLGIHLGKCQQGVKVLPLYKKIAFFHQLIAVLLVGSEIFCRKEYYSPGLLYQIQATDPTFDFKQLSAVTLEECAQEALYAQQRKFIVVLQQPCFDDLIPRKLFHILFTDRARCVLWFKEKEKRWEVIDYLRTSKGCQRRTLSEAETVDEAIMGVCKEFRGASLPYPIPDTAVTPLSIRLKACFSVPILPKEIDPILMQLISACKRGGVNCLDERPLAANILRRKSVLLTCSETSLFFNVLADLKYAADYEHSIRIDPAYHGYAIVLGTYLENSQFFAERNRFNLEHLQTYAAAHLSHPETFLALPDFFIPGHFYLFIRHKEDLVETRHFKLALSKQSDLSLKERFNLNHFQFVFPPYDALQLHPSLQNNRSAL